MKKIKLFLSVFICICVISSLFSGCAYENTETAENEKLSVAMIATQTDITDRGYNFAVYSACKKVCEENNLQFTYYKVLDISTDSYMSVIDAAINDGYNVVVLNDYNATRALRVAAEANPDVKFIIADVEAANFGKNYKLSPNLTCWRFDDSYAGFMAGYAAVKEGYSRLGFMGGMPVASVMRYGYGYIQGADAAAKETGDEVVIEYVYSNRFMGDSDLTAYIQNWYQNKLIDVVFACAGSAWTSVATAAAYSDKKVIGVDVDQREIINQYTKKDTTLTSAMKGMDMSVEDALSDIVDGNWDKYSGKSRVLTVDNAEEPEKNYLKLPMEGWSMKNFTTEDYKKLVKDICGGKYNISSDISNPPSTEKITVNYCGTIK